MSPRSCVALAAGLISIVCSPVPVRSWIANGSPVCMAPMYQYAPRCISDGTGGFIVTWHDSRLGEANTDIYAQRVSASGTTLWAGGERCVCSAPKSQTNPIIVDDGAGGAVIAWYDFRGGMGDIYAQRLDGNGTALWTADGVPLCTNPDRQYDPSIASDGAGGAIVAWLDDRASSDPLPDIYAQRVSGSGALLWAADGSPVTLAVNSQTETAVASDGAQGAIIAWCDTRYSWDGDIFAQHMSASGSALWGSNGAIVCNAAWAQRQPAIVSDGGGGAYIAWLDDRSGVDLTDIYAQHVSGAGGATWNDNGLAVCQYSGDQADVVIAADGDGGALLAWLDSRPVNPGLYAQRIAGDGSVAWTAGGAPVRIMPGVQSKPAIVSDGAGGVIVAWLDMGSLSSGEILAQRVNASGIAAWPAAGVSLCASAAESVPACIASDGAGGALVAWQDMRSGTGDIFAQRVRAGGELVATPLARYGASLSDKGIVVAWRLGERVLGAEFLVERSNEAAVSSLFATIHPEVSGDGVSFAFVDAACGAGDSFRYRVSLLDDSGGIVLFETDPLSVPAMPLALQQNHPNPFNPSTEIRFYLPERGRVALSVFDVHGTLVRSLDEGVRDRGYHTALWDGRNQRGEAAASGVYLCRLRAGKETLSRKMVLMR